MSKLLFLFGRAVFCYPLHDQNTMEWVVFKVPAWHTLPKFTECFTKKKAPPIGRMKPKDFHRIWRLSIIFRWTMLNLGSFFPTCVLKSPQKSTSSYLARRCPQIVLDLRNNFTARNPTDATHVFWSLGHPNNPIRVFWLTVDGWKKSGVHQLRVGSLSMFIPLFARFMHSRWCKISSISSLLIYVCQNYCDFAKTICNSKLARPVMQKFCGTPPGENSWKSRQMCTLHVTSTKENQSSPSKLF